MIDEVQAFHALIRKDLSFFTEKTFKTVSPGNAYLHNWHIDAMTWHLKQCAQGKIKRLVITMPPRNLKSICASVAFPAWVLGLDPTKRIISITYADALAVNLSNQFRQVVESEWYKAAFPEARLDPKKNTEFEVVFRKRGYRLSTTIEGTLTGRGADYIIIDDPLKAQDANSKSKRERVNELFPTAIASRLDDKATGVIIVVMQRLHRDDLAGHLTEREGWTHLNLPAIAEAPDRIQIGPHRFRRRIVGCALHPERESLKVLRQIKKEIGSATFSAQYQQAPVPPEGNIVSWKHFRTYTDLPPESEIAFRVWSWDLASKAGERNDYSVGTLWYVDKHSNYYLVRVVRKRLRYPDLRKLVTACAALEPGSSVLIEDSAAGMPLIQELEIEGLVRPIAIRPDADKVTRMSVESVKIENGKVWLPKEAPWLEAFREEVLAFPNGRHDDQVDSMSQFLAWVPRIWTLDDWRLY